MAKIPEIENTTRHLLESVTVTEKETRGYLGASSIGKSCWRAIWYAFHMASPKPALPIKLHRIFQRGHLEEKRIVDELKAAGMSVFKVIDGEELELTGEVDEQQESHVGFAGHVRGHPDGRVIGLPESKKVHLLEIKTAKESRFKDFMRNSVKDAAPVYYAQVQWLMGKMKLSRCLFVVTNKNDESRYYERIEFDKDAYEELERKSLVIVTSIQPPDKIHQNRNWIDCRMCNHRSVCHDSAEPDRNCRTCDHSDIEDGGGWSCGKQDGKDLSLDDQILGCDMYEKGWGL